MSSRFRWERWCERITRSYRRPAPFIGVALLEVDAVLQLCRRMNSSAARETGGRGGGWSWGSVSRAKRPRAGVASHVEHA